MSDKTPRRRQRPQDEPSPKPIFVIPFAFSSLPPDCERLPEIYATAAEAQAAGVALGTPCLIERHVSIRLPERKKKGSPSPPAEATTTETYQVLRCSALAEQALREDMLDRFRRVYEILGVWPPPQEPPPC